MWEQGTADSEDPWECQMMRTLLGCLSDTRVVPLQPPPLLQSVSHDRLTPFGQVGLFKAQAHSAERGDHEVDAMGARQHHDRKVAAQSGKWTRAKVCIGINIEGHLSKHRRLTTLLGAEQQAQWACMAEARGGKVFLEEPKCSAAACGQERRRRQGEDLQDQLGGTAARGKHRPATLEDGPPVTQCHTRGTEPHSRQSTPLATLAYGRPAQGHHTRAGGRLRRTKLPEPGVQGQREGDLEPGSQRSQRPQQPVRDTLGEASSHTAVQ